MSESMQFINASGEVVGEISLPQSGFAPNAVNGSTCECCNEVDRLSDAIAAVLELHEPEATGYGDWVCGACISAGSHDWESTAYPCPTVTAIRTALGERES